MTSLLSRQIRTPGACAVRPAARPARRQAAAAAGDRGADPAARVSLALPVVRCCSFGSLHTTPPGIPGSFDLSGYRQVLTWPTAVLFANTVGISLLKTIISLALAVLFGWIIARTNTPARGALRC